MRFGVISIHYTNKCNLNCPFCYVKKGKKEKPLKFWYGLVPYLTKLTQQVAVGGGEPFTNMGFIKKFAKKCKEHNLICNVTSNGKLLMDLTDKELKEVLKDITMISLSFDRFKVKNINDLQKYKELVIRIKKHTKAKVGSNLLIDREMFEKGDTSFIRTVEFLFREGIERVFALYPKNIPYIDILPFKVAYSYLTAKYKHFYIDDTTKQILEQGNYDKWEKPCYFGKGIISINSEGYVCGCSFDSKEQAVLRLDKPEDILKIKDTKFEERLKCPYLKY